MTIIQQIRGRRALVPVSAGRHGTGAEQQVDPLECSAAQLVALAKECPERLGDLLNRYRAYLAISARRFCEVNDMDGADCSAIVQQTCLKACRGFPEFRGATEGEFTAWVLQIHQNNLKDAARRKPLIKPLVCDADSSASINWREPAADQTTPSQHLIRGENALRLACLLASLPPAQAEAVRLRHMEGWPVNDIAKKLDRTPQAAAGLIKRGLETLRSRMSLDSWS